MDFHVSIVKTIASTSQGTSTGAAKKSENGLDIANVIQTENEESTVTDANETESTMTYLRGRKVTTAVVVYHDETETLTEIGTTIGNQTQVATDDIGEILNFFCCFLFLFMECIYNLFSLTALYL